MTAKMKRIYLVALYILLVIDLCNGIAINVRNNNKKKNRSNNNGARYKTIEFNKELQEVVKCRRYKPSEAAQLVEDKLYHAMSDHNNIDSVSFNTAINAWALCHSKRSPAKAEALLSKMTQLSSRSPNLKPNVYTFTSIISAHSRSGLPDAAMKAQSILEHMEHSTSLPNPNTFTYNAAIDAWARSSHPNAPLKACALLQKMKLRSSNSIAVDRYSYNAAIKAWANSSHKSAPYRAEQLFQSMIQQNIAPDKVTFSILLHAYVKSNHVHAFQKAQELLELMKDLKIKPDVIFFSTIIAAWAKSSNNENSARQAFNLLQQMEEEYKLHVNVQTLNSVLLAIARCTSDKTHGGPKQAECFLYENMMKRVCKKKRMVNVVSFNTVIDSYSRINDGYNAERILHLLEKMYQEEHCDEELKPNRVTYSTVIKAYANSKDERVAAKKADEILEQMERLFKETGDESVRPDTFTYVSVIEAYAESRHKHAVPKAEQILSKLLTQQQEQQQHSKNNQQQNQNQNQLDISIYAAIINAYTKTHPNSTTTINRAEELLSDAEYRYNVLNQTSMKPNDILYGAVLQAFAKSKSCEGLEKARALLQQCEVEYNSGEKMYAKPTTIMYNAVIDALARCNDNKNSGARSAGSNAGFEAAEEAEGILNKMLERYQSAKSTTLNNNKEDQEQQYYNHINDNNDEKDIKPSLRSFNGVLLAYKNSNHKLAPTKSLSILQKLNDFNKKYNDTSTESQPDDVTFNTMIGTFSKSASRVGVEKALSFLEYMERQQEKKGNGRLKPGIITYYTVHEAITLYLSRRLKQQQQQQQQQQEMTRIIDKKEDEEIGKLVAKANEMMNRVEQLYFQKKKNRRKKGSSTKNDDDDNDEDAEIMIHEQKSDSSYYFFTKQSHERLLSSISSLSSCDKQQ